ncbi:MAG TPA: type IV pilus biogenesis/stability protein PilW [Burkholderiales bacterium]|nr:type IV pilus biogenesis/stability protein PilW [Burkholderiales bacterium]
MRRAGLVAALVVLAACTSQKTDNAAGGPRTEPPPSVSSPLDRAKIHTELGVSYFGTGQLGVALEELNIAVSADKSYAPAYNALGLVYMELKEDAKAEKNFRQAIKLDPSSSEAKNNYGLFLCQRGREQEGIRQLLDALKNPLYATPDVAYKNAGLCARKAGDTKAAEDYFVRALKLNPRQPQALYGMAEIDYLRDDYAAAKQYISRYFAVAEPPGPEALWLGARVERKLGDRTALANYGMQLRRRYPSAPETKAFLEGRFE